MSNLQVLELNDREIRLSDGSGLIAASPGFALAQGNELELGVAAQQQVRLHPASSFDKFWQQLSLDPVKHGSNAIRHLADLAYAHLQQLAELSGIATDADQEVILAVPGNFDRQQLAILLGLIQQSSFKAVGLIDSALAAALATIANINPSAADSAAPGSPVIYADLQLHQVLLTKVANNAGQLRVESVVQVPGVGTQNFMNLMMQLVTGLFIQQCRFNPQHDARSEQQLYNALPGWLNQNEDSDNSLLLELTTDNAVHRAKLPQQSLVDNLNGHYQNINRQISALGGANGNADTLLVVSEALASLPGFHASLNHQGDIVTLKADAISQSCLHHAADIVAGAESVHLVSSIALDPGVTRQNGQRLTSGDDSEHASLTSGTASADVSFATDTEITSETQTETQTETPTHALYADRAFALPNLTIGRVASVNGNSNMLPSIVLKNEGWSGKQGQFECQGDQVFLQCGDQGVLLNNKPVTGRQSLQLGDQINFADCRDSGEAIRLIRVNTVRANNG